jgi:hypothetical protein
MMDKFEGEPKRRRPTAFRVMVHLKNIPLKLWSRETATRILEDFDEPVYIDDATTVGPDRYIIYEMVPSVLVHVMGIWEEVFVIVVDWANIDGPLELADDYLYGRIEKGIFGMEDSAKKSLARGSQRL